VTLELITPRLQLREFNQADFLALCEMNAFPEMHTFEREPPSVAETRRSLESYINNADQQPRTSYQLAITIPPSDTVRGLIKLSRQWEAIREWEVGWAVHPADWGHGYATEAAWHMMDWGFKQLNIHRLVAFCHASNAASVRVMEKLGMHRDGILRETRWLNGSWWDEYVYAILEKEWKSGN
jgi:ribosomal-protein-alanine N-acetyltransferase